MTLLELDSYFNSFLHRENFPNDPSRNGIQIQNSAPDKRQITKAAFAVDACEMSAEKAAAQGAQVLFVHHGLFWGDCSVLTGNHYKRIAAFMKNDIALCAYHIPLDANEKVGNNAGLAERIGLRKIEPFGKWRGMDIGVKGVLRHPVTLNELAENVMLPGEKPLSLLDFGVKEIRTVGIISGGAGEDVVQAAAEGLDVYITGSFEHEQYHYAEESGINVLAGGHYQTETVGVNLVRAKLEREKHIETVFIDIPTGL
ncbi:MAG: Nif3-like dinuclear metal center hexameric protein [Treponema sp.]|nr:Nif3-like dinuclear metal center hexameric protein [Treponema sp.]